MYLGGHVGGEDGEEAAREGEPDDEAHAHDPRRRHHLKPGIGRKVESWNFDISSKIRSMFSSYASSAYSEDWWQEPQNCVDKLIITDNEITDASRISMTTWHDQSTEPYRTNISILTPRRPLTPSNAQVVAYLDQQCGFEIFDAWNFDILNSNIILDLLVWSQVKYHNDTIMNN